MILKRGLSAILILALLTGQILTGCKGGDSSSGQSEGDTGSSASSSQGGSQSTAPGGGGSSAEASGSAGSSVPEPESDVDRLMAQMTLEQKVGQLFFVRPEALVLSGADQGQETDKTVWSDAMAAGLDAIPVGGIILFGDNITDPDQLKTFTSALHSAGSIPLFLGVDEEGGAVARLARKENFGLPTYKSAASVASAGDPDAVYEMGNTIGGYLREYGFNVDFAPVADVNTNPNNPVIGTRAFSSEAPEVLTMASARAQGLRENGIIPTFKHFPGHGDTAEDSHTGLALTNRTREEMETCEWIPFTGAQDRDFIMVGHIAAPEVTGDQTPASLSETMVTGVLRDSLGFNGIVITDSMEMGAITELCGPDEAAVKAIAAGCDIVLMPQDLNKAYNAVIAAVQNGTISEARLDESVRRILERKSEMAGPLL